MAADATDALRRVHGCRRSYGRGPCCQVPQVNATDLVSKKKRHVGVKVSDEHAKCVGIDIAKRGA